jgi:hypothetical protein
MTVRSASGKDVIIAEGVTNYIALQSALRMTREDFDRTVWHKGMKICYDYNEVWNLVGVDFDSYALYLSNGLTRVWRNCKKCFIKDAVHVMINN